MRKREKWQNIASILLILLKDKGRGNITAISTSNIRNKIVIKKKRKENERRILCCGSKPHSKGDVFSRIL